MPTSEHMDLIGHSGGVALITGAAGGIGAATARRLAARGMTVVMTDRADGADMARELGAPHRFMRQDVSDPDEWPRVLETLDRLDVLHLNAGVSTVPGGVGADPLSLLGPEDYHRVVGVNLGGVIHGIYAALPIMDRTPGRKRIIVTSSTAGLQPFVGDPLYTAAKHGLIGLTRGLAQPLARRDIVIAAVCPGATDTGFIPEERKVRDLTTGQAASANTGSAFQSADEVAAVVEDLLERAEPGDVWVVASGRAPARKPPAPLWD
jgi:NAD(P)-dependent dehydrogenase (short-subunit alcohol dehydrogenase family)